MRRRNWCLTINNPTEEDLTTLETVKCRYLVYQLEKGEIKNTEHFQCYIEYSSSKRFNSVKRTFPTAHIEPRKGSRAQAREYCMKTESSLAPYKERGEFIATGARTDIDEMKVAIANGATDLELCEEHFATFSRHMRCADRYRTALLKERSLRLSEERAVEVIVIIGDPGTGKTRYVYDTHGERNVYTLNFGDGTERSLWFDGYEGESILLLDDYSGQINYDYLLRLLDRYSRRVQIKGSHTYLALETIYITSNEPIDCWYVRDNIDALLRRVSHEVNLGGE